MAGIAALARELGHHVTGSDEHAWPPMSDQLREQGIEVLPGYDPAHLDPAPDQIIVGNAMSRGNPAVEHMLDQRLPYTSGPAWLAEHLLRERWVLAVAGTHGKTTTSAMLAWVLDSAGMQPGFLIGGVPRNFDSSARVGNAPFFVIEADEYDTAFFDKRSKFVHYHPKTQVVTNIEHDHVDIFPDIASILRQFHHLVRILPRRGELVHAAGDAHIAEVLALGCWSPCRSFGDGGEWTADLEAADGSCFSVLRAGDRVGRVEWDLIGTHNVNNALAAIAAAAHAGVAPAQAADALGRFQSVKRRLEVRGCEQGVTVYDDFAHHPTAIQSTLAGLRAKVGGERILALLDPRSNSMRAGLHRDTLAASLGTADRVWIHAPADVDWDLEQVASELGSHCTLEASLDNLVDTVVREARPGDHVLAMSNGAFGGIHQRLLQALSNSQGAAQ